jgi:hypothetical protein
MTFHIVSSLKYFEIQKRQIEARSGGSGGHRRGEAPRRPELAGSRSQNCYKMTNVIITLEKWRSPYILVVLREN